MRVGIDLFLYVIELSDFNLRISLAYKVFLSIMRSSFGATAKKLNLIKSFGKF